VKHLPTEDHEVWAQWPHLRPWFNKLDLALRFGYLAGPNGVPVPKAGNYVVRPIYNLLGMGLNARIQWCERNDCPAGPGEFWCEAFSGEQVSLDLQPTHHTWEIVRATRAVGGELGRPTWWERIEEPALPLNIYHLEGLRQSHSFLTNIEAVDGRIIEVHFRPNPDPEGKRIYPVFDTWGTEETPPGMRYQAAFEDCDGRLQPARKGFFIED
jgi:hypothetical protein